MRVGGKRVRVKVTPGLIGRLCHLTPECWFLQHSSHVRQANQPQSQKGSAVKKTECSVGALQGHRRHQPAEMRCLQIAWDISDDKALLYKSKNREEKRGKKGQRVKKWLIHFFSLRICPRFVN